VLVVEDEPLLRELVAEAFTRERAQAEAATDGEEGWTLWRTGRYDLVVSDQRMPTCTGLELLGRIRDSGSEIPFILMSGYGLEGLTETLASDPRVRTLSKPFRLDRLFTLAASLL
jgi:CheY-like chemotaxis protein